MSRIAFVLYQRTPVQFARLRALSVHVDLHLIQVTDTSPYYSWDNVEECPEFSIDVLFSEPPTQAQERKSVVAALKRKAPDIIFVLGYGRQFSRAALSFALKTGTPAVLISDTTSVDTDWSVFARSVKSAIARGFQSAFVAGSPQSRYVESLGIRRECIFLGYDVVDNEAIANGVAAVKQENPGFLSPPIFLCIARLIDQKNLPFLIESFKSFTDQVPQTERELHIAGYGPLREELEALIASLGLTQRVKLLGGVDYSQLPALLASADTLVLPSWSEPWGLVVNEAMAAGLAVVASSAVGSVEDLVNDGRNGYVIDPTDHESLVAAFVRLDSDPRLPVRMGEMGRSIVSNWSLDRFVQGAMSATRAAESAHPITLRARFFILMLLSLLTLMPNRARGFEGKKA